MNPQAPQYILLAAADDLADQLSAVLTDDGYQVISTATGEHALEAFRQYRPAMTILDTRLRQYNSRDLIRAIRNDPAATAQTLILAITTHRQPERNDELLEAGVDDLLFAPLNQRVIQQRVRLVLDARRNRLEQYRHTLQWMPDAALLYDVRGRIITINETCSELTGYRASELTYSPVLDLFLVENPELKAAFTGQAGAAGTSPLETDQFPALAPLETRLLPKDGAGFPVRLHLRPLDDGYWLCVIRDQRDQLHALQVLRETEHRYRDLFDAANDAILIIDMETSRFLNINKLAGRWLGYKREEMLNMTFSSIDVPLDDEQRIQVNRELSTNGRMIYEQYYRARSGKLIPVEVSSRMIKYEGRRAFLCFARDITRRREMEEAERRQRRLAEALSASAAALNNSLDFDQIIRQMLVLIGEVLPCDAANIMLLDGAVMQIIAHRGYEHRHEAEHWDHLRVPLADMPLMLRMQIEKAPLCVADTHHEPAWYGRGSNRVQNWIRSYVGAPIIVGDEVIGVLSLDHSTADRFTEQDAHTLMAFANHAGIALQNARLFQRVQLYADDLEKRVQERTGELSRANAILQAEIEERQRAETALTEERYLLRTLIDALPDDVYVKDRDGRYLVLNESVQKRLRHRQPHLDPLGKTDADYMALEEALVFQAQEDRLYATGQPLVNQESRGLDPDGNEHWLLVTKVPLRDRQGEIIGLVGINRDVTALRGVEEQLAYVVTGANCLLWDATVKLLDDELRWDLRISSEAAAQRFLPLPEVGDLTYARALERSILPEDALRINQTSRLAILNNHTTYSHEYRCRRADGEIRWLYEEVRLRPLGDHRWSLVGVASDITERRQAAQALQEAYEQLEQRVAERTAELSQANAVLKQQIGERRRAENALRESEEKYRSFTNQLPFGAYRISREGVLLFANPALARILGFPKVEAMIGESIIPFYTLPQVREKLLEDYRVRRRQPVQSENPLIRRDGRVIWVRDTGQATFADNGEILYIDGTIEDITERILIEQAELEQRMFAEALRDAAADLTRTLELDEVLDRMLRYITRVMPQHESASIMLIEPDGEQVKVLRYRNLNANYHELPRPPMRFNRVPNWAAMYETGEPIWITDTRNEPDWGKILRSSFGINSYVGAPIVTENRTIGFINLGSSTPGVFNETHARRLMSFATQVGVAIQNARLYATVRENALQLQQRVQERTAELDTERTRLRAILDAMTEGVIYYADDGRVLYTNRSLSRLVGYDEAELYQPNLLFLLYTTGERTEPLPDEIRRELDRYGIWRYKTRIQRRDGSDFDGSLIATRVTNVNGASIGTVTVIRDVSQETRLERQKKRFIAVASHELRTPITNLKTRLYLIRRQPERLEEHLSVMEMVSDRMRRLVDDLLDLSRFEQGTIPLDPEYTLIPQLLANVLEVQIPEAERKGVTLTLDYAPGPLEALVDVSRFAQVITNLLTNAIQYTPAGGTVSLEAFPVDDEIVIRVCDTGVGIPEEWLEQVFQPFFRGSEQGSGSGLGLSITREIVELHGGRIEVQSEVGVGTCFQVWLKRESQIAG